MSARTSDAPWAVAVATRLCADATNIIELPLEERLEQAPHAVLRSSSRVWRWVLQWTPSKDLWEKVCVLASRGDTAVAEAWAAGGRLPRNGRQNFLLRQACRFAGNEAYIRELVTKHGCDSRCMNDAPLRLALSVCLEEVASWLVKEAGANPFAFSMHLIPEPAWPTLFRLRAWALATKPQIEQFGSWIPQFEWTLPYETLGEETPQSGSETCKRLQGIGDRPGREELGMPLQYEEVCWNGRNVIIYEKGPAGHGLRQWLDEWNASGATSQERTLPSTTRDIMHVPFKQNQLLDFFGEDVVTQLPFFVVCIERRTDLVPILVDKCDLDVHAVATSASDLKYRNRYGARVRPLSNWVATLDSWGPVAYQPDKHEFLAEERLCDLTDSTVPCSAHSIRQALAGLPKWEEVPVRLRFARRACQQTNWTSMISPLLTELSQLGASVTCETLAEDLLSSGSPSSTFLNMYVTHVRLGARAMLCAFGERALVALGDTVRKHRATAPKVFSPQDWKMHALRVVDEEVFSFAHSTDK